MTQRKRQYNENKVASVGTEITCPICGKHFTKKQYSQAFCCRQCKDTYWNAKGDRHSVGYYEDYDNAHPERKKRRILYGSNRIVSISGELTPRAQEDAFTRLLEKKLKMEIYDLD